MYRKFKILNKYYQGLSQSEKKVLKILEKVVKDTGEIYDRQLKEGFYPKGATKRQLEKENEVNPQILSPFTYIEEKNGRLEAIPYYVRYAKYLKPIARQIEKAANICTNPSFKQYLMARAQSLSNGDYREAFKIWLKVKNSNIDFVITPLSSQLDNLFLIKRAFQAYVGIIDKDLSRLAESYKETLYSSAKLSFSKYHSTGIPQKGVNVFVEVTPIISGYPADALSSGQHYPVRLDTALKYGSKIILYESQINHKFEKLYYPIFKTIFEKRFASRYSKELLLKASRWSILLYELGKQLHYFAGAKERLEELYGPIDEANGFASGIEHSKHLVVKGLLSQEQLEAIMIVHIVWMLSDWLLFKDNIAKQSHIRGNAILLNSYLSHGALKEREGISWPNFSRIFFEIEEMTYKLVYLLQKGSYKEASQFIKKNANVASFERFSQTLGKIDPTSSGFSNS
ncbi:hypothetical protein HYT18_03450 [Candidatus Microgenomates bacterium]|nr:hypothetical protein [Candidatus Microgenomates bacterium]